MIESAHTVRSSVTKEIDDPGHRPPEGGRRGEDVLRDGSRVHVRAVSPEDLDPLRRMFARLSPKSMYQRFHSPFSMVPEWVLGHAVHVDHRARESLVAVSGGEIVGQAMYVRPDGKNEAEIAVVVEDAWQRRGIGTLLLGELAVRAERRGIEVFTGVVLHENSPMLGLAVAVGGQRRYSIEDGAHLIRVPLRAQDRRALDASEVRGHRGGTAMGTRQRDLRSRSSARSGARAGVR